MGVPVTSVSVRSRLPSKQQLQQQHYVSVGVIKQLSFTWIKGSCKTASAFPAENSVGLLTGSATLSCPLSMEQARLPLLRVPSAPQCGRMRSCLSLGNSQTSSNSAKAMGKRGLSLATELCPSRWSPFTSPDRTRLLWSLLAAGFLSQRSTVMSWALVSGKVLLPAGVIHQGNSLWDNSLVTPAQPNKGRY